MAGLQRLESVLHLEFFVEALTGLHIGGSESGIAIGGSDNPVIRDPLTARPYVPGSSFKGKMRSLLERRYGLDQNQRIGQVFIHTCIDEQAYTACPVCPLFGIPAPRDQWFSLTRMRFPDIKMEEESARRLDDIALDMPYTEVKTEVAIDRVTSAASPRNIERVPAGTRFGPGRLSLFRYSGDDVAALDVIMEGLHLLEADYLGGSGARGSGRIAFRDFDVSRVDFPADRPAVLPASSLHFASTGELQQGLATIKTLVATSA